MTFDKEPKFYDREFREFLQKNLDFNRLRINRVFNAQERLLTAYEYFDGIGEFIASYFGPEEINDIQYQLIEQSICEYLEQLKKQHHELLLKIIGYLPLRDVIMKVSRLNRKMYIVCGDLDLYKQYYPKYQKYEQELPKELKTFQVQKNKQVYLYDQEVLSFDGIR